MAPTTERAITTLADREAPFDPYIVTMGRAVDGSLLELVHETGRRHAE